MYTILSNAEAAACAPAITWYGSCRTPSLGNPERPRRPTDDRQPSFHRGPRRGRVGLLVTNEPKAGPCNADIASSSRRSNARITQRKRERERESRELNASPGKIRSEIRESRLLSVAVSACLAVGRSVLPILSVYRRQWTYRLFRIPARLSTFIILSRVDRHSTQRQTVLHLHYAADIGGSWTRDEARTIVVMAVSI